MNIHGLRRALNHAQVISGLQRVPSPVADPPGGWDPALSKHWASRARRKAAHTLPVGWRRSNPPPSQVAMSTQANCLQADGQNFYCPPPDGHANSWDQGTIFYNSAGEIWGQPTFWSAKMMSESHQPYVVHSEFHNDSISTRNNTASSAVQGPSETPPPPTPANWSTTPEYLDVIVLRSHSGSALTIRVVNPQPHPISATIQWGGSFTPRPGSHTVVRTLTSGCLNDSNNAVDQMRVVPKVTEIAVAADALTAPLLFPNASFTVITIKTDDLRGTAQKSDDVPLRVAYYYTDLSSGQENGALLARVEEVAPLAWRRFSGNPTGIAKGVVLGHDSSPGGGWDAGGQEGTTCLQVRNTVYCYTGGDRLGWSVHDQAGHGHAIGLATSVDGGITFRRWTNHSTRLCTTEHEPFECCTGMKQGTCDAHANPLIVELTDKGSWNAGGGSCDITRNVGTPYVIYDEAELDDDRQRWKMWYGGSSNNGTTGMTRCVIGRHVTQVAYAHSPDGVSWVAANGGQPVFNMQTQTKAFPSVGNVYLVVKGFGGTYYMCFAPNGDKVGLATSSSPEGPWTAYTGNPILSSKHTQCPNPTTGFPLPFVYERADEYLMILGCMDRNNRISCPGGATSHPVVPFYLKASSPNSGEWVFLAHSLLLNRSANTSFDYCSCASIRFRPSGEVLRRCPIDDHAYVEGHVPNNNFSSIDLSGLASTPAVLCVSSVVGPQADNMVGALANSSFRSAEDPSLPPLMFFGSYARPGGLLIFESRADGAVQDPIGKLLSQKTARANRVHIHPSNGFALLALEKGTMGTDTPPLGETGGLAVVDIRDTTAPVLVARAVSPERGSCPFGRFLVPFSAHNHSAFVYAFATGDRHKTDDDASRVWSGPDVRIAHDSSGLVGLSVDGAPPVAPLWLTLHVQKAGGFINQSLFNFSVQSAARVGVNFICICLTYDDHMMASGAPWFSDTTPLDEYTRHMLDTIVELNPYALFVVRFYTQLPSGLALGADNVLLYNLTTDDGPLEMPDMNSVTPQWALAVASRMVTMLAYLDTQYPHRVAGVFPCSLTTSENFLPIEFGGPTKIGDYSNSSRETYCRWRGAPANCTLPKPSQRNRPAYGNGFSDGESAGASLFYSDTIVDAIETLTTAAKKLSGGNLFTTVFYGYLYGLAGRRLVPSGHLALQRLLRAPSVDAIASPYLLPASGQYMRLHQLAMSLVYFVT